MAAHEMKRLGMAHKPMIIGLKANVAEIAAMPWRDLHLQGTFVRLNKAVLHPAKIRRNRMGVEQAVFIQPACILRVDARPGFTLTI